MHCSRLIPSLRSLSNSSSSSEKVISRALRIVTNWLTSMSEALDDLCGSLLIRSECSCDKLALVSLITVKTLRVCTEVFLVDVVKPTKSEEVRTAAVNALRTPVAMLNGSAITLGSRTTPTLSSQIVVRRNSVCFGNQSLENIHTG